MPISTDLIAKVRDYRQDVERFKEHWQALCRLLEEEHKGLLGDLQAATNTLREAEESLRQAILAEYQETGNKQPAPGCGVRILTKLDYDEDEATGWALEHRICLNLDKKTFERVAKAQALPFVTVTEEPQPTISTDLAKALVEV